MEWILFLVILIILLAIVFNGVSRKDKKPQKNNHDTSSDHSSGWWAHSASDAGDSRNDHCGSSDKWRWRRRLIYALKKAILQCVHDLAIGGLLPHPRNELSM